MILFLLDQDREFLQDYSLFIPHLKKKSSFHTFMKDLLLLFAYKIYFLH